MYASGPSRGDVSGNGAPGDRHGPEIEDARARVIVHVSADAAACQRQRTVVANAGVGVAGGIAHDRAVTDGHGAVVSQAAARKAIDRQIGN